MNDHRPTRWPCSADSSRKAGPAPRSFRKADTGVSQSSTKVCQTGTRLYSAAASRTASRPGERGSATAGSEHLLRVGEREAAGAQQHGQVVEQVGGLLGDALAGLLAGGARDLLGLLLDLLADERRVGEQLGRVGAARVARGGAGGDRALEARQDLVRRRRLELAAVEAGPLAGVARGAGRLDQRQHGVAVAVQPQRLHRLRVAGGRALVPELLARAAVEVQLTRRARALERLAVHVGEAEDLARSPVLDDARDETALVE